MNRLAHFTLTATAVCFIACSPIQTVNFPVSEPGGRSVTVEKFYASAFTGDPGDRSFNELSLGHKDEAIAILRASIAATPTDSGAHYDIAIIQEMKGDWQSALAEIREAKRLAPHDKMYLDEEAFIVRHASSK